MKLLGISLFALRLPMLAAGALAVALLFSWSRASTSLGAGITAALLLVSDPMWQIFSRLSYTDLLLAVFTTAALFFVFRDPRLERHTSVFGFAIFTAAAIMTKNVAGAIPILTLILFAAVIRREQRPRFLRIVQACLVTVVLVAPWHVYQLIAHFRWFWADYIQTQLLAYGVHPPAQISSELPLVFYAKRLFLVDPVLCLFAVAAIPGLWMAARRRDMAQPILLSAWLLVVCLALSSFQVRGQFRWVLFLIPPLCMLAACFSPVRQKWPIALLCLAFAVKAAAPAKTWGLSFGAYPPMPSETWLRTYSHGGRPNPLVLVETDDELYSAVLPLPKIHYCWIDPSGLVQRLAPHYVELGITVTAAQFDDMERWEPVFRKRLREWGLNSGEPIATAVVAESDAEVAKIVAAHSTADFYLPARFRSTLEGAVKGTHELVAVSDTRFFLLAKTRPDTPSSSARVTLPGNW
jgi:Dolichyl-phosphate-mannose-protein mannosyltransferase